MSLTYSNNNSLSAITSLPSAIPTDKIVLISTQTASNSSSISFTSGINGTYDEYQFHFISVRPTVDVTYFGFQGSTNGGSTYGVTTTGSFFEGVHDEADTATALTYRTDSDIAQATTTIPLFRYAGGDADQGHSGTLTIFNPSSTTYVKHFIATVNVSTSGDFSQNSFIAGYMNTTSAINAIKFSNDTGNFDGTIKLYGVVKS